MSKATTETAKKMLQLDRGGLRNGYALNASL